MKIYIDKMRIEIDLKESNKDIFNQIIDGIMLINSNELMIQEIKCCNKTKKEIVDNRIKLGIDELETFCTAKYIIDDSLPSNIVILYGGLPKRLYSCN